VNGIQEEERKLFNPILSENRQDILIFDLRKIDPLNVFGSPRMKAGMLLYSGLFRISASGKWDFEGVGIHLCLPNVWMLFI
jgi:hypothetical protein